MANLVGMRTKQEELRSIVKTAANNVKSGITVNLHHRLASEYNAVSRRDRNKVFGQPWYYCEILPDGTEESIQYAGGQTSGVPHVFDVWLIYEWSDADPYAGSSQETFDNITESLSPKGVLPKVRDEAHRSVSGGQIIIGDPQGPPDTDIIPLGQDGGKLDTAHRLNFQVTIKEPT